MQLQYSILSPNQKRVLEAIITYIRVNNVSPTTRELQKTCGLSPRGVTLQLEALEKQDFITRKPGARGIVVHPSLINSSSKESVSVRTVKAIVEIEEVSIPMMTASIPAGPLSYIDEYWDSNINVSLALTKGMRNVFAIKVTGDSMIGASIEDGDVAIIAPQPVANDGDIVAAVILGAGVTLKRYRIVDNRPLLMPANPKYKPITEAFQIQGKLINIIKPSG